MMFKTWLESNSHVISINLEPLKNAFNSQIEKVINYLHQQEQETVNFNPTQFINQLQLKFNNYPSLKNLLQALQSRNPRYIVDQQQKLRTWLMSQPYNKEHRDISRQIYTYLDSFESRDIQQAEQGVKTQAEQAINQTKEEMKKLESIIQDALNRIPKWNNSPVVIEPNPAQDQMGIRLEPTTTAEIHVANIPFTVFQDEKFEIDDVVEGGDDDFFHSPQVQADYFNLINELRKPGSTNKGKLLTLYTARPKKDRQQLIDTKTLPLNVFLANNFDHVEGLAHDFGNRDLWKVKIDSRYLTLTLDSKVKEYQVTTDNAPFISMELLSNV